MEGQTLKAPQISKSISTNTFFPMSARFQGLKELPQPCYSRACLPGQEMMQMMTQMAFDPAQSMIYSVRSGRGARWPNHGLSQRAKRSSTIKGELSSVLVNTRPKQKRGSSSFRLHAVSLCAYMHLCIEMYTNMISDIYVYIYPYVYMCIKIYI